MGVDNIASDIILALLNNGHGYESSEVYIFSDEFCGNHMKEYVFLRLNDKIHENLNTFKGNSSFKIKWVELNVSIN